jgi:hypothetical protein
MRSRLPRSILTLASLVTGLSACGGTDANGGHDDMAAGAGGMQSGAGSAAGGSDSNHGGSSGGGNPTGGSAVGGNTAVGGNAAAGGAAGRNHFGQVALINHLLQGHPTLNTSFVDVQSGGPSCTSVSDGDCVVSTCDDGPAATQTFASAGTITITSPQLTGSVTQEPDASGGYTTLVTSTLEHLFLGGETAVFKASGAAVPAFEEQLPSPLVLLLSAPLFVKGSQYLEASRSQDLALTWTRGAPGVLFYITGGGARADGLPGSTGMTCQFPSETGSGSIKSLLLQQLGADTHLAVYTVVTKTISAGQYGVVLGFVTLVGNPDKALIPGLLLH